MANLSIIPPEKIDFESYKNKLKEFLRSQHQFTDYDFEGSNISVLLDLLARNTYYNATYLNMVGSEMWLDSAELRSSVVSHAKELNYTPRSRSSARCTVTIEITPNNSPTSITIPRFYKFRTTNTEGRIIFFVTDQEYLAIRDSNGRYIFRNVELFEGDVVYEYFNVESLEIENGITTYTQRFVIESENIDINSLEVFVAENSAGTYTKFDFAENLYGIDETSLIYFVEGFGETQYEIVFGDGVMGKAVSQNNSVMLRYRNSSGRSVNGSYIFSRTSDINGYTDIAVTTTSRVEGGSERESIDSIKFSAPRYYQTQERAVSDSDYEILIKKNFPTIQQVNVFGGELVYQYGKVMIVLKPFDLDGIVSNQTKRQIKEFLKPKNFVPETVILDPDYYYLGVAGNVYYQNPVTSVVNDTIKAAINEKLEETNSTILGSFNSKIYQSTVNEIIKSSDSYITGSDITLSMYKVWNPVLGVKETFTFTTDNSIFKPDNIYNSMESRSVSSSTFQTIHNDVLTNAMIQDDGVGKIYLYTIDNSGVRSKVIEPIGTINYETGTISFVIDVHGYSGRGIVINCQLKNDSVTMEKDKFIIVDSSFINLNVTG